MKKGQVTFFIIIAILIVAGIITFFILKQEGVKSFLRRETTEQIAFKSEIQKLSPSIEGCISETLTDGARLVGLQGGYLEMPEKYVEFNYSNVAYGYYQNEKTLPSKNHIEKEISSYIKLILPFCINDLDENIEMEVQNIKSKTEINKNSISVYVTPSISFSKKNLTRFMETKYFEEVPIKLNEIYSVAEEIIKKESQNPEAIELTYLADLDYEVAIIPYNNEIIVYSITDKNNENPEYYYSFMFANKLK